MIALLLRKAFFDYWDNLLPVLGFNILGDLFVLLPVGGLILVASSGVVGVSLVVAVGVLLVALLGGVINQITWALSRGERFRFNELPNHWKVSWRGSLVFGVLLLLALSGIVLGLPIYAGWHSLLGLTMFCILVWLLVLMFLMLQYYWPMNAQVEQDVGKLIRKSLLIFVDNPGLTVFLLVTSGLWTVVSVLTVGIFPGFVGILLWNQTALKLLLYKYDYLETLPKNSSRRRVKIPWSEILKNESDRVGKRSLKGMFLPWKD